VVVAGALWPTPGEWLLLLLVGVCAQLAQIYLTRGLARMPAGPATVILYLQILFATLWGILFLGERPDLWTAAGALLILAGTVIAAKARSRQRPGLRGEGVTVESPE
jgi:drug/metabolite transporter (DMT)-like permease